MKRSRLCLTVTEKTIEDNVHQVKKFARFIDLVELRADYLNKREYEHLQSFPKVVEFPTIFTLRSRAHGGRFMGTERERHAIIAKSISGKFAFIDREENANHPELDQQIAESGARIIRSFHDFEGVPKNLASRMRKLRIRETDIPKAAVMPRSTNDVLQIVQSFQELRSMGMGMGMEKILLGMGEFGLLTRILAPSLGSYLSYCSPPGLETAPGHLEPELLATLYRFKEIDPDTEIYAIIGNPVKHSISPQIHNRGFAALGLNAVYLPMLVDNLSDFFPLAELLKMKGVSITMPHKVNVLKLLTARDESVTQVGACNTLVWRNSGWMGSNTDVEGFLTPLNKNYFGRLPRGLSATVIGAGGVARAVVYALVKNGCEVLVLNRTKERARRMGNDFGCRWAGCDEEGIELMKHHSELIVQATSVGMEPEADCDPLPDYVFQGSEVVYDLVYQPHETLFLKRAERAGCRIIHGIDMLNAQAYAQFRLFTGRDYPEDLKA